MADHSSDADWFLINEFAGIRVCLDSSANGPRLEIEDLKSGAIAYFDPLQLEGMVWAQWEDLRHLVDPSRDVRWSEPNQDETGRD